MPAAMPLLCGDNPLSNTVPAKFLRLTDTQLFLLKQWADGKFINEHDEHLADMSATCQTPANATAENQALSWIAACSATCSAARSVRAGKPAGSCAIRRSTPRLTASTPAPTLRAGSLSQPANVNGADDDG